MALRLGVYLVTKATYKLFQSSQIPPPFLACRASNRENARFCMGSGGCSGRNRGQPAQPLRTHVFCWALSKGHSCQSSLAKCQGMGVRGMTGDGGQWKSRNSLWRVELDRLGA